MRSVNLSALITAHYAVIRADIRRKPAGRPGRVSLPAFAMMLRYAHLAPDHLETALRFNPLATMGQSSLDAAHVRA